MLTATIATTGQKVIASQTERELRPFTCPQCGIEVIIHKGNERIHHFAHKSRGSCTRGAGESEKHWNCKNAIYEALLKDPRASEVELERDLGTNVADVYAVIKGQRIAIELQKSILTVAKITERTARYTAMGIHVLWIVASYEELPSSDGHRPMAWERWLHELYYQRVYYWSMDDGVVPIHYVNHFRLTRFKWVRRYRRLVFIADMVPKSIGTYRVMVDDLPRWWKPTRAERVNAAMTAIAERLWRDGRMPHKYGYAFVQCPECNGEAELNFDASTYKCRNANENTAVRCSCYGLQGLSDYLRIGFSDLPMYAEDHLSIDLGAEQFDWIFRLIKVLPGRDFLTNYCVCALEICPFAGNDEQADHFPTYSFFTKSNLYGYSGGHRGFRCFHPSCRDKTDEDFNNHYSEFRKEYYEAKESLAAKQSNLEGVQ